ncbi:hypothetical protein EsH8_I_000552 [Colletotrichum jinshuiense]
MSGAEALLGIVAGGAGLLSLGIQLGEVALKLRRIYHKVKDAPQTVANLAFSLETMAIALRELEEYRHENSTGVILDRCILECQRGVAEAQRLTNVMEDRLARHPKLGGKVYAAFRDRDINALLDDLEKAKSSLELTYMIALAQEQKRRDRAHYSLLELQQASINNLREQVLIAAQCGQLEVCRYLLGLTTWPDHAAVLSNALGWFAYSNFKSFAPEMYRIFLGSSEFEFDLDGEYHYRFLVSIPILWKLGLSWSLEFRF